MHGAKNFFGHLMLQWRLNIHMNTDAPIHYKDLDVMQHRAPVMLDHNALDVWEYWFGVAESRDLVETVIDITDVLEGLTADAHIVKISNRTPDALIHFVVEPSSSAVAERLYHRGARSVSWDLSGYTPGIAPIPAHVLSTPECTGLLTVGGERSAAHRGGYFWCDSKGNFPEGYPRLPGINPSRNLDSALYALSVQDLGVMRSDTRPGRAGIYSAYWKPRAISNQAILGAAQCDLPHTRRYVTEYRRRLKMLRAAIARHHP